MKKLLFILALLFPLFAHAEFTVPWQATSTTGWIFPIRLNGNEPLVTAKNFFASSTIGIGTSTIPVRAGVLFLQGGIVSDSFLNIGNIVATGTLKVAGNIAASSSVQVTGSVFAITRLLVATSSETQAILNSDAGTFQGTISVWDEEVRTSLFSAIGTGFLGTRTNHPLVFRTNDLDRVTISATGLTTLSGGYISQASSTVVGDFKTTGALIASSTLSVTGSIYSKILEGGGTVCSPNGVLSNICTGSIDLWTLSGNSLHPTNIGQSVGVGTTSPSFLFSVHGNAYIVGTTTASTTVNVGGRYIFRTAATTTIVGNTANAFVFATSSDINPFIRISTQEGMDRNGQLFIGNASTSLTVAQSKSKVTIIEDGPADNSDMLQFYNGNSLLFTVARNGHTYWSGSVPILSACGTAPALDAFAHDSAGQITVGTNSGLGVTSCTLTFGFTYSRQPTGFATDATQILYTRVVTTLTTAVIDAATTFESDVIKYFMAGKR